MTLTFQGREGGQSLIRGGLRENISRKYGGSECDNFLEIYYKEEQRNGVRAGRGGGVKRSFICFQMRDDSV